MRSHINFQLHYITSLLETDMQK